MAAVDVKKIIQDLVVPELHEIKTKLATVEVEIRRLDQKIDTKIASLDQKIDTKIAGLEQKIDTKIAGLEQKIDSVAQKMDSKIAGLEQKIDSVKEELRHLRSEFHLAVEIRERLAALEAKIGKAA
ncbi:MAG: hypothetical protein A3G87_04930 [Omnitrophica bacterium RIFCSPLOWO2_12_FULL_50_11]|nr:MAG: hypothetical protein A3G87_04930 [Omnitrophica bacterium RIFCSPLOWO2_12_FULL_50_11]